MKAYELIEKGWCQSVIARDAAGAECGPDAAKAVSWCIVGVLQKVCGGDETNEYLRAYDRVSDLVQDQLVHWNDHYDREQADVVAVLKQLDI